MKYTNKFIRLHSKCLQILEVIQNANNRIATETANLNVYDNGSAYSNIRLFRKRSDILNAIAWHTKAKDKLVNFYAATVAELVEDTIEKCVQPEPKGEFLLVTNESYY